MSKSERPSVEYYRNIASFHVYRARWIADGSKSDELWDKSQEAFNHADGLWANYWTNVLEQHARRPG